MYKMRQLDKDMKYMTWPCQVNSITLMLFLLMKYL
jgi:hypothetical protein